MAHVELRGLGKRFGALPVLHGVDLDVAEGEFCALLGPSGCGKSTLLRVIAGLEDISSGELMIGGRRVNDVPPAERGIAMVFQSYALYPHMTLYKNMAFGLKIAASISKSSRGRIFSRVSIASRTRPFGSRLQNQLRTTAPSCASTRVGRLTSSWSAMRGWLDVQAQA